MAETGASTVQQLAAQVSALRADQSRELRAEIAALRSQLNLLPRAESSFPVADSTHRLRARGDSHGNAMAVVTVLPAAQTGVAVFSLKAFAAAPLDVDVFAPFASPAEYLGASALPSAGANMSFYALRSLRAGCEARNYRAVVWVIGNSDDFIPVLKLMRDLRHLREPAPTWIELHDPFLLNVADKCIRLEGGRMSHVVRGHLRAGAGELDWHAIDHGDYSDLVENGYAGVRSMLNDVPFTGLLVHSKAAKDIVRRDWPELDETRVSLLFHPVFEPYRRRYQPACESIRMGSFGVPNSSKKTELVLEAFRLIRAQQPDATLVLAGYQAAAYARDRGLLHEPGLSVVESPGDSDLHALMTGVDVAVQLRLRNLGESSGIIPQLLALDVPVLASPSGAMRDFGRAVAYVPEPCDASQLAQLILKEASHPEVRQAARESYSTTFTPTLFCKQLVNIVDGETPEAPNLSLPEVASKETGGSGPEMASDDATAWHRFEQIAHEIEAMRNPYFRSHLERYRHTLAALEELMPARRCTALEMGTTWVLAVLLKEWLGFSEVDVTDWQPDGAVSAVRALTVLGNPLRAFSLDLESAPLPVEDDRYDLVICCEVLEHLDVDPMFMLAEINRTLAPGGKLLLTTPNVTSSRNTYKILNGHAPHFFMQYQKDRGRYRHNIEYAPEQVAGLLIAAGLRVDRLWTADTFEAPVPEMIQQLKGLGYPVALRGDNMFVVATKTGPVVDRYPPIMYV
jgi:glycosyltransferase involved in cell wall biosynthesis/SAM-dependent methyltransferase